MGVVHVFADVDNIDPQGNDDPFGPKNQNENNQFQLTSKLNINSDIPAYAAFTGTAIVQEVDDPNISQRLVNLILRPNKMGQLRYPRVKYFIYRGLAFDSIFTTDGNGNDILIPESQTNPHPPPKMVKEIHNNFNDWLNDSGSSQSEPPITAIGFNNSYANSKPIEEAFFEELAEASLFPILKGWHIGNFKYDGNNGDDFKPSVEVVIEESKDIPDMAMARSIDHVIDVNTNTNDTKSQETIDKMREREKILNYIDPAVFYNKFWSIGGVDYKDTSLSEAETKTKEAIYNSITDPLFDTSNTVYIDIRNHFDYSLNYYQDNINPTTVDRL